MCLYAYRICSVQEHGIPLTYIALDWHEMDKQLGHEGIVEAFWNTVRLAWMCYCVEVGVGRGSSQGHSLQNRQEF